MKKIYCKNCRWYQTVGCGYYAIRACYKVLSMEDTPIEREAKFAECEIQNKNNDCKYYTCKRYKFWVK